ncbi:helix-turn-helix transcriptional regulator [Nesterenkonia flava]|uniref:WYL domain-containing protein n=1 Tax=Nesterenkonia flava TaxID=469799 RepID=A0ABU1FPW0_9MICC|nr:WYL domain-containing protein [Nesterenkonia flava]MDR5710680.1 WYL domain-containing protein [Nesterenkonia flava]
MTEHAPEEAQDVTADYGVARAFSLAATLLEAGSAGLTKAQLRQRVAPYRDLIAQGQSESAWERTFSRDKAYLRGCGLVIPEPETTGHVDYRYRLDPATYGLQSLSLTPVEMLALQQARHMLSASRHAGALDHALWALSTRALAQSSEGSMHPSQAAEPGAGAAAPAVVDLGSEREIDRLLEIAEIGLRRPLVFDYTALRETTGGPAQRRTVALGLGVRGRWYLVGHDLDRDQLRTYRLDRIHSPVRAGGASDAQAADSLRRRIEAGELYPDFSVHEALSSFPSEPADPARQLTAVIEAHRQPAPPVPRLRPVTVSRGPDPAEAKIERVLNMTAYLLSEDGVPPSELMAKYGQSPEQLQRDLLSIQQSGTFDSDQFGDYIDVRPSPPLTLQEFLTSYLPQDAPITLDLPLRATAEAISRPISLTTPGALALLIGCTSLAGLTEEPAVAGAADAVARKLADIVPETVRHTAESLALIYDEGDAHHSADREAVQASIRQSCGLQLVYRNGQGERSERLIEPVQLVHHGPRTYVRAWCTRAQGERLFLLHRIITASLVPDHERSTQARALLQTPAPRPAVPRGDDSIDVVLRFSAASAAQADAYAPERQVTQQGGSRVIATHVRSPESAVQLCLDSGGEIELLKPAHLREDIVRRAHELLSSSAH